VLRGVGVERTAVETADVPEHFFYRISFTIDCLYSPDLPADIGIEQILRADLVAMTPAAARMIGFKLYVFYPTIREDIIFSAPVVDQPVRGSAIHPKLRGEIVIRINIGDVDMAAPRTRIQMYALDRIVAAITHRNAVVGIPYGNIFDPAVRTLLQLKPL
jgi:hypothetical protein